MAQCLQSIPDWEVDSRSPFLALSLESAVPSPFVRIYIYKYTQRGWIGNRTTLARERFSALLFLSFATLSRPSFYAGPPRWFFIRWDSSCWLRISQCRWRSSRDVILPCSGIDILAESFAKKIKREKRIGLRSAYVCILLGSLSLFGLAPKIAHQSPPSTLGPVMYLEPSRE